MNEQWIVIPNWERYQHYSDRAPAWIKDHASQLDDDDYVELTLSQRGLLSGLRLMYAASDGRVPKNALRVSQRLGSRVTEQQIEALRDAGFIQLSASKPVALTRARERALEEKRREEKKEDRASAPENQNHQDPREAEPVGALIERALPKIAQDFLDNHKPDRETKWEPVEDEPF